MNLISYDFHDGYILDLRHDDNNLKISMESAEIDPDEVSGDLELSKHNTVKGTLHIEKIKKIKMDNKRFFGKLKMDHDEGDIFDFRIIDGKVLIKISWIDHEPKRAMESRIISYEIEGTRIFWENNPQLYNPYWP